MNEHSSKKILFNKTTLLNLKAELLKKQEEVLDKKQQPRHKIENFKPPVAKSTEKTNDKPHKKSFKDSLKETDVEELEACRKAKAALEKKAKLYEHLSDSLGTSQLAGNFLVDFEAKKQEAVKDANKQEQNQEPQVEDTYVVNNNDDDSDEWTEFTDCLGRTRKCHKSDLDLFIKRDKDLMRIIHKEVEDGAREDIPEEPQKEKPLLVQKTNDYLQLLREKWEARERELMGKDRDIHYQDLLFDEARIHGVGYYSFSTDEEERKKQMEDLIKRRQETLQAQKQAEEARKKRDEIIAARVKAARARQRARAGLPPEEPKENEKDFTTCLLEFLTKQRNEAEDKAKEEERKRKEEQEKERQKLRETYIREWDLGKEGVEDKVKKFREMTQEEYVEQQRSKRIDEFAPVQSSSSSKSEKTFDDTGRMVGTDKTWSDVRPPKTPPPLIISDVDSQKGLFFSTKKQNDDNNAYRTDIGNQQYYQRDFKYRNFVKAQEVIPIVNEISDNSLINNDIQGTEIAPPPTYEYYGPVPKKTKYQIPFKSDIREAYAQGTKSLEHKAPDRQLSKQYDFTLID